MSTVVRGRVPYSYLSETGYPVWSQKCQRIFESGFVRSKSTKIFFPFSRGLSSTKNQKLSPKIFLHNPFFSETGFCSENLLKAIFKNSFHFHSTYFFHFLKRKKEIYKQTIGKLESPCIILLFHNIFKYLSTKSSL